MKQQDVLVIAETVNELFEWKRLDHNEGRSGKAQYHNKFLKVYYHEG
jgi:hypothetical protein